jgi:hypothetical protein
MAIYLFCVKTFVFSGMDRTENAASNTSSIVACMSVVAITEQWPLFTESYSNGCCITADFMVIA